MTGSEIDGDDHVLVLARDTAAIADARRWVASVLLGEGVPPQRSDDTVLVASELVTNAVRHGDGGIVTRLRVVDDEVHLSVSDDGAALPALRHVPVGGGGGGGLGLHIVERLARRWGVEPAGARGKTVWAVLGPG